MKKNANVSVIEANVTLHGTTSAPPVISVRKSAKQPSYNRAIHLKSSVQLKVSRASRHAPITSQQLLQSVTVTSRLHVLFSHSFAWLKSL